VTRFAALILSLLVPICAIAQTIRLPLDGYFRPGGYFPVAIDTATRATIEADVMPTRVPAMNGIAPVFAFNATTDRVRCGDQSLPLHALGQSDRLVGFTGEDDAIAAALFPDKHVIRIDLGAANPLPGPAMAWDSLDAAIVDAIDPQRIPQFLAAGITIAVKSESKPDSIWPWIRVANAWVLRADFAPAQPSLLGDTAYLPTYSWTPGRSRAARQAVVLVAVLVSCILIGVSLWRSKWSLPALAMFSILFFAGFEIWQSHQSPVATLSGEIQISHMIDRWDYVTSVRATSSEFICDAITWPVFASTAHARAVHPILECRNSTNAPAIHYDLPPEMRLAYVSRTILANETSPAPLGAGDVLRELARQAYPATQR
jgi:hypothetical protein